MATGEVNYRLKADASGMTSEVEKARRSVDGLDKSQKSAGKSAKGMGDQSTAIDKLRKSFAGLGTVIAGLGIGLAFRKMIQNTAQQDAAMAQLNATLKSTEFAAGKSAEELTRTAASLQKVTTYGDEAIIGMQSLLLTFKDIKGDNFDRTTRAVLDMSTAMGQDLKSSAIQLGKALNDPIGQLGALSRTGVTFSDTQKDMIKSMAAAGDMAGAQVLILKELESQFGGSAEAARDTLGGALKGLENAYNDLFEAESSTSASMVKGINSIEKSITNPALKDGINLVIESLMKLFEWITKVYEGWYMLGQVLADGIAKLREQTGWFTDDLDRMGEELTATVKPMEMLREVTVQAERNTKDLGDAIRTVSIVSDDERESVDRLQSVVVTATKINKEYSEATRDIADSTEEATAAQSPFQQALQGTAERIDTAFKSAWQGAFDSFSDFADGLKNAFKELLAELAHLAITRPIIMNIGAAFGLGGASGAASAAGGLSGGGSLLSGGSLLASGYGALSSGLSSLGGAYTAVGNYFGAGTSIGNNALAVGRGYSYGSVGSGLANAGLNLGAGVLGGYAGGKVFGDTTG
ncbi:MAG: phage tail length tape measure family protein, partial [Anaerolineae bacterium]|nr:phage tail length tape measure family protein [Anaerolineae bacterium]